MQRMKTVLLTGTESSIKNHRKKHHLEGIMLLWTAVVFYLKAIEALK